MIGIFEKSLQNISQCLPTEQDDDESDEYSRQIDNKSVIFDIGKDESQ